MGVPAVLLLLLVREHVVGEVEVDLLSVGDLQLADQRLEGHVAWQQNGVSQSRLSPGRGDPAANV